jgi:HEAT repeat protein
VVHGAAHEPGAKLAPPTLDLAKQRRLSTWQDPMTRRRVAVDLRRGDSLEALAILMGMIDDPDAFTRKQSAWSLGVVTKRLRHQDRVENLDQVLALLRGLADDENSRVRDFALYARARLGEVEARRAIPAILADEARSRLRRQHGREALRDGGGPVAS